MKNIARRVVAAGLLVVIVASGILVGIPVRAADLAAPYDWTIAVYGDADNNLEGAWDKYSDPALMGIPTNERVKVVAAVDRFSTLGTEIIEYAGGTSTVAASYEEKDFGSWETLIWFIQDVTTTYPSEKLALILWDHGGGWWGICWDDTDGGYIDNNQLQTAISTAGVYIDVLGFDACLMSGIEVVYCAYKTGMVGMMVASEQLVPYNGFPYDLMFSPLAADPELSAEQVADDMVAGWGMYYGSKGWVDLSAINVATIGGVVMNQFVAWKDAMSACLPTNSRDYATAFKKSELVKDWYLCDFNLFAGNLLSDRDMTDPALRDATLALMAAIDTGVNAQTGGGKSPLAGVTFWFGFGGEYVNYGSAYANTPFAIDTGWYDFMTAYNMM